MRFWHILLSFVMSLFIMIYLIPRDATAQKMTKEEIILEELLAEIEDIIVITASKKA